MKHIMIEHSIHHPKKFAESLEEAVKGGTPDGFRLKKVYVNQENTKSFCLWEAPSIEELKKLVDPVNKEYSINEYWEVDSFGE